MYATSEDSDQPAHSRSDQDLTWAQFRIANDTRFLHAEGE